MHLVEERATAEDTADALGDAVVALVRAYRHAIRHPVASALSALELALLLGEGELRLGELAARRGVCQSVVSLPVPWWARRADVKMGMGRPRRRRFLGSSAR